MKKNLQITHLWIYLFILGTVFVIIYTMIFDVKLDMNGDNAHYLNLAKNLSRGLGYSHSTPNGPVPASHFPPGYPAFLSLFMFLGVNSLTFFKVLNGVLFFTSLLGIFYLIYTITNHHALAFVSVLLALFSPATLRFSTIVMSEILFLFCSVACFLALYRYCIIKKEDIRLESSLWLCLVVVSAASAYHVRAAGIALIFAIIVFFLFRKQWLRGAAVCGSILLLLLPWWIRNKAFGIESRYLDTIMTVNPWRPEKGSISSVGEFIQKMIANLDETVIKGFKEILFPFIPVNYEANPGMFQVAFGLCVVGIIFHGAWSLKPIKWALIAYLVGQIGLFMLWHGGNESRYVVPVAPFIIACFYIGLYNLIITNVKSRSKTTLRLPYMFLVMIFWVWPPVKSLSTKAKAPYPTAFANYVAIAQEMQKQMPAKTICCCRKPEFFTYFAPDLYAMNYLYSTEPEEVIRDLIDKQIEYVVLEQLGYVSTVRYLYPAIVANRELFDLVWQLPDPDTYLLKFNREKAMEKFPSIKANKY